MTSPRGVCTACGGDVVHVGTYSTGMGEPTADEKFDVGFCLACGEALRLVDRAGTVVAEPVPIPPPT